MTTSREEYTLEIDTINWVVLESLAEQTGQTVDTFLVESVYRGVEILRMADQETGPRPLYLGFATSEVSGDLYPLDLTAPNEDDNFLNPPSVPPELAELDKQLTVDISKRVLPIDPDMVMLLTLEAADRGIERAKLLAAFIFFNTEWHKAESAGLEIFIRDANDDDTILSCE